MKKIIVLTILNLVVIAVKAGFISGPIPVTATETNPHGGGFSKALIYIDYKSNGFNLIKPLIVFEGFDPGYFTEPKVKEGRTGVLDFISDLNNIETGAAISQLQPLLQGTTQDYDIVYVNWVNGTDYLENNALVAEEVIRHVNWMKAQAGSTEPNVIIGKSMGSLIARMALRRMENRFSITGQRHNTRLYISLDGGQQGSNIPQGYQHMANQFRDLYIKTGPLAMAIEGGGGTVNYVAENISLTRRMGTPHAKLSVNETPASRQLSINHVNNDNDIDNDLHNNFLTSLNNLGYPTGDGNQAFNMIAISNGSECAKPQNVGNGGNLLSYKGIISTTFLSSMIAHLGYLTVGGLTGGVGFSAFAFPPMMMLGMVPGTDQFNIDLKVNAKANNVGNQVYKGKIEYIKKVLGAISVPVYISNKNYYANAATLAYDYFPGGNQDLSGDIGLPEAGNTYFLEKDIIFNHQPACHVPVPSALDIGQGNVTLTLSDYFTPYQGFNPPTGTKSSAFPGFITAFNGQPDNEGHTQLGRRNGDWIAKWLQGTQQLPFNCSYACAGNYILGENNFCNETSGSFSIASLPTGAEVIWTVEPAGIVTVNTPTAATTTLTKITNGAFTLKASIVYEDCESTIPVIVQKQVHAGPLPISIIGPYDPIQHTIMGEACVGEEYYFVANDTETGQTYSWVLLPPMGSGEFPRLFSGSQVQFDFIVPGYHTLRLTKTNSCGTTEFDMPILVQECFGFRLSASPNPATNQLTVSINDESETVKAISSDTDIKFELFDFNTAQKQQQWMYKNTQKTFTLNLKGIKSGNYLLRATKGKYTKTIKIVVN